MISIGQQPELPYFGTGSATWSAVFEKIINPSLLWDVWKPSQSLDRSTVESLWECWNTGEVVRDESGHPIAMKPPLRLVEQQFRSAWRPKSAVCYALFHILFIL